MTGLDMNGRVSLKDHLDALLGAQSKMITSQFEATGRELKEVKAAVADIRTKCETFVAKPDADGEHKALREDIEALEKQTTTARGYVLGVAAVLAVVVVVVQIALSVWRP